MQETSTSKRPSWIGLTPLLVFLLVYLVASVASGDFYKMPIAVAFLVASGYALAITRGLKLEDRVLQFSRGAADTNILLMIWIFILAGAFAGGARSVGAVDATVDVILSVLPPSLLLPGLFLHIPLHRDKCRDNCCPRLYRSRASWEPRALTCPCGRHRCERCLLRGQPLVYL